MGARERDGSDTGSALRREQGMTTGIRIWRNCFDGRHGIKVIVARAAQVVTGTAAHVAVGGCLTRYQERAVGDPACG